MSEQANRKPMHESIKDFSKCLGGLLGIGIKLIFMIIVLKMLVSILIV